MKPRKDSAFIAFGSNLGNRRARILEALGRIKKAPQNTLCSFSSIIETDPVGGPRQGKFLNAVAKIETSFSPYQLLIFLQSIEHALGRERGIPNGPRSIDLDILLFSDKIIHTKRLCIPHPEMLKRDFVMGPLLEVEPDIMNRIEPLLSSEGFKQQASKYVI